MRHIAEITPRHREQAVTSETSDYAKHLMGYMVSRLMAVYGPRFQATYKTDDELIKAQREWAADLERMVPEQYGDTGNQKRAVLAKSAIDDAVNHIKRNMGNGERYEWPNVGSAVRLAADCVVPSLWAKPPAIEHQALPIEESQKRLAEALRKLNNGSTENE